MATENTLQALLAPALFWLGGTLECHGGLAADPDDVELHLCTQAGNAVVRIPMPQSSLPFWPESLTMTAASLGRPVLVPEGDPERALFRLVRVNGSAAVTYAVEVPAGDGQSWEALPSGDLQKGETLAFSIAYGTDFLVPSAGLNRKLLEDNPLCIDREYRRRTSASAASETRLSHFLITMREVLVTYEQAKSVQTPLISLALCPECMDGYEPVTARAVSEVRSILHGLFVPVMSDLGLGAVVVRAVSERGIPEVAPTRRSERRSPILPSRFGWLGELREFEVEVVEFQKELTRPTSPNAMDPALHVVKRVSLLVHLASMLASAEGARLLCAWPPVARAPQETPLAPPSPVVRRVPPPPGARESDRRLSQHQMDLFRSSGRRAGA